MRKIAFVLTPLVAVAVFTGVAAAGFTHSTVKATSANEQNPAASTEWFAWTQSPQDHPTRTRVMAESRTVVEPAFRVNPSGTRAWTGGIEGDQLVYQEIDSGDSDVRLYDLTARTLAPDQPPINTDRWEWHPTISTDSTGHTWIMFGRQNTSTWVQRVYAYNVDTLELRILQETTNRRYSLIPGQVNGDLATWTSCKPNCHVRYDDLLDVGAPITLPRPSSVRHQYGSSIGEDGRLYYVRSGAECGSNVRIMRHSAGTDQLLVDLPDRRDVFFTYVDDQAGNDVYYDRVGCGAGTWNIYKVVDP